MNSSRHCIKLLSRPSIDERERVEGVIRVEEYGGYTHGARVEQGTSKKKKINLFFIESFYQVQKIYISLMN